MLPLLTLYLLLIKARSHNEDSVEELVENIFPHHQFECDPQYEVYETEFSFLEGLGRGFVHAERKRIFFEYYFPASHWVGVSTADQSIQGEQDQCSACYFSHYYPLKPNKNGSNLYPKCIEECLEDTIFVATVNSDEKNINNWDIIEFQIIAQQSKQLEKKMYRIPPPDEILEIWGSSYSPYRLDAHFETDIYTIGSEEYAKEYVHAKFWRRYDFAPDSDLDEYDESNEWNAFVHGASAQDLYYPDSLCFISIGSFYGGEYPYDDDALQGLLPGFYIDTQHLANIHCYLLDEIKVDCGQDWSWLTVTKQQNKEQSGDITDHTVDDTFGVQYDDDNVDSLDIIMDITTTDAESAVTTASAATSKETTATTTTTQGTTPKTLQPIHGEDCCSAISQISYDDIHCLNISLSLGEIDALEHKWKAEECGRPDKLPTDLSEAVTNALESECDGLWAYFNQIHEICYKFSFTKNRMKIYNHFKSSGGYECFDKNNDECKKKETEIGDHNENFNNFNYDESNDEYSTTNSKHKDKDKDDKESELAEMEEDGGLTVTSLGVLGVIVVALTLYVLYWFCCSNSSKGYRQSSQFMGASYYDDDMDTDDYTRRKYGYNKYCDADNDNDNNSDWSEDEQLGVIDDDHNKMEIKKHKTKGKHKNKKSKNKRKKKGKGGYDININDVDSMPIHSDNGNGINDAVEINIVDKNGDDEDNEYYYYDNKANETLPSGHEPMEEEEIHDDQ